MATKTGANTGMYRNFVSPQIKDEKEGWQKRLPFNDEQRLKSAKARNPTTIKGSSKSSLHSEKTSKTSRNTEYAY